LTEHAALLRQEPLLGVGEAQALLAEPAAKHAVLGEEVCDRVRLRSLQPPGDEQDEELQRAGGLHRARPRATVQPTSKRAATARRDT